MIPFFTDGETHSIKENITPVTNGKFHFIQNFYFYIIILIHKRDIYLYKGFEDYLLCRIFKPSLKFFFMTTGKIFLRMKASKPYFLQKYNSKHVVFIIVNHSSIDVEIAQIRQSILPGSSYLSKKLELEKDRQTSSSLNIVNSRHSNKKFRSTNKGNDIT